MYYANKIMFSEYLPQELEHFILGLDMQELLDHLFRLFSWTRLHVLEQRTAYLPAMQIPLDDMIVVTERM